MYKTRALQLILLGSVLVDKCLKGLYCPLPAELLDLLPVLVEVKCREAINLNAWKCHKHIHMLHKYLQLVISPPY